MYIVYLDDSKEGESTQIIGAVIIRDQFFNCVEQQFGYTIAEAVPADLRENFEFHSGDLLSGNKPFQNMKHADALHILGEGVAALNCLQVPSVMYGAVDIWKLKQTLYATANPIDIAFRVCAKITTEWFKENAPDDLGLFISDDGANQHVKKAMQYAFHQYRPKVRSSPLERGILPHALDDMYFGDSKYSVGIQLADICSFLIRRHMHEYSDTEDLYAKLEKHIFKGATLPDTRWPTIDA